MPTMNIFVLHFLLATLCGAQYYPFQQQQQTRTVCLDGVSIPQMENFRPKSCIDNSVCQMGYICSNTYCCPPQSSLSGIQAKCPNGGSPQMTGMNPSFCQTIGSTAQCLNGYQCTQSQPTGLNLCCPPTNSFGGFTIDQIMGCGANNVLVNGVCKRLSCSCSIIE